MKDLLKQLDLTDTGLKRKIPCPKCGSDDSFVRTTRQRTKRHKYPGTRRRKQCRSCNNIFITVEILESDYREYLDNHRFLRMLLTSIVSLNKIKTFRSLKSKLGQLLDESL